MTRSFLHALVLSFSRANLPRMNFTSRVTRRLMRSAFCSSVSSAGSSSDENSGSGELSFGAASLWRRDVAVEP